ncbi:Uncharacterised protein [Acinetobacter baumannii]|nr:Uncharacterised protein [Acinetobacter baumannii]
MIADPRRRRERPCGGADQVAQPNGRGVQTHRLRGQSPVRRVRPDVVVVDAPAFDDGAGLGQGGEDLLVQALVAEPAVEAFDEAILLRLARRDVMPGHAGAVGPLEDRPAGHLRPVVADDHGRASASGDQPIQFPRHALAPDRGVDHQSQGLAREVVHDAQDAEASAPRQTVGHEVQRPALVWAVRQGHGRTGSGGALAAPSPSHRQAFLPIEPEQPLLVHADALPFQQDAQAPVAEPAALSRQAAQALAHLHVARFRLATHRLRIDLNQPAGALLGEAALRHQAKHGRSARCRPDQFFPRRSFSADTSSIDSASSFFSRRFSSSSVFSFWASDTLMPLYFAFHR